jgi:hypothetical protein
MLEEIQLSDEDSTVVTMQYTHCEFQPNGFLQPSLHFIFISRDMKENLKT